MDKVKRFGGVRAAYVEMPLDDECLVTIALSIKNGLQRSLLSVENEIIDSTLAPR
jgi:hypothetical protein